jgi:hypothetical protein
MAANDRSRLKFPLKLDRVAGAAPAQRTLLRPQRDVAAAHADARRRDPPSGLGLDSAGVRQRMAQRLGEGGIGEARVLAAFAKVPRTSSSTRRSRPRRTKTRACRSATARRSPSRRWWRE